MNCAVFLSRFLRVTLIVAICALPQRMLAQPRPTNIKVLDEHSDGHGNIIRTIQYNEGLMRVTTVIIEPKKPTIGIRVPFAIDTAKKDSLSIFISKSNYMLQVRYRGKIIRTYKAVFGPNPLQNKLVEGDRNTPEGVFRIANKNPASKYDKFMGLNYPNDSALVRFNKLKASGAIPPSSQPGGNVGIHGIWQGGDDMIQLGIGWTDGCIALKNKDIEELFSLVTVGTKVVIRR